MAKEYLTVKELHRISHKLMTRFLEYNPETGDIVHTADGNSVKSVGDAFGTPCWKVRMPWGAHKFIDVQAKQLIWFLQTGTWRKGDEKIVHINGDTLDDRWSNLRAEKRAAPTAGQPSVFDHAAWYILDKDQWVYGEGKEMLDCDGDLLTLVARNDVRQEAAQLKAAGSANGAGTPLRTT